MMKSQRNQLVAAFLAGTLLGLVAGAKLYAYRTRKLDTFAEKGPNAERVVSRLSEELGIDAQQAAAIRDISEKRKGEVLALQTDVFNRFEAIRLGMRDDIRAQLNDDQRKKFDALASKWDVQRRQMEPQLTKAPPPAAVR